MTKMSYCKIYINKLIKKKKENKKKKHSTLIEAYVLMILTKRPQATKGIFELVLNKIDLSNLGISGQ